MIALPPLHSGRAAASLGLRHTLIRLVGLILAESEPNNTPITVVHRLKINLEEQGAYILLYCHCWRGFRIEYDMEILSKMCNCRLDKIKIIFPKIEHLFYKEKDKNGKTYLICKQAEEERKEQKMNRKRRSMAGKLGAKKRWSEESLEEDENTRHNTSRRKT